MGSTNTISEKDDLYNPFDERNPEHPNSDNGTLIHLLKSSLGTGILMMPLAFSKGGLIFGVIGTILTGILCTHCVHILVSFSSIAILFIDFQKKNIERILILFNCYKALTTRYCIGSEFVRLEVYVMAILSHVFYHIASVQSIVTFSRSRYYCESLVEP